MTWVVALSAMLRLTGCHEPEPEFVARYRLLRAAVGDLPVPLVDTFDIGFPGVPDSLFDCVRGLNGFLELRRDSTWERGEIVGVGCAGSPGEATATSDSGTFAVHADSATLITRGDTLRERWRAKVIGDSLLLLYPWPAVEPLEPDTVWTYRRTRIRPRSSSAEGSETPAV